MFLGHNIRKSATSVAVKVLNKVTTNVGIDYTSDSMYVQVGEKAVNEKVAGLSCSSQMVTEVSALMKSCSSLPQIALVHTHPFSQVSSS